MTSSLDVSYTTLAERFRDVGYATSGVASHVFLKAKYGLSQGFEDFDTSLVKSMVRSHEAVSSPGVTRRVLEWLDARAENGDERPFLMWAHYFDPHAEYLRHKILSKGFASKTESDRYRGELRFTDAWIGRLLAGLRKRGLDRNTIIVLVADHGEEFKEHGATRHGHGLYEELIRVPFVIHVPDGSGLSLGPVLPTRTKAAASVIDIMPTLLELCDIGVDPKDMAGVSLVPAMLDEPGARSAPRPLLSEVGLRDGRHMDAVVFDGWKLIIHRDGANEGQSELYNIADDPGETLDLAVQRPRDVQRLKKLIEVMQRGARARGESFLRMENLELDADDLKQLSDLGYTGSDPDETGER